MKIRVNGIEQDSLCADLACLWDEQKREQDIESDRGVAIALNGAVVRREDWRRTEMAPGDAIEIVRAFAGG